MEPQFTIGLAALIIYVFVKDIVPAVMKVLSKGTNGNGNGSSLQFAAEREREMGALIERMNNLTALKDVVEKIQDRIGGLAENVQSFTMLLTNEMRDIKSRLDRLEDSR